MVQNMVRDGEVHRLGYPVHSGIEERPFSRLWIRRTLSGPEFVKAISEAGILNFHCDLNATIKRGCWAIVRSDTTILDQTPGGAADDHALCPNPIRMRVEGDEAAAAREKDLDRDRCL
jgi:hypothetical protein